MKKPRRGWMALGGIGGLGCAAAGLFWLGLSYQPDFYRRLTAPEADPEARHGRAEEFVAQSLQLRNDIVNEPRWSATFTDHQVNAWLAEDLVKTFADQIPEGVSDPRVIFEPGRATLAFKLADGPITTVVWVVLSVEVRGDNELALVLEKVRAGALPLPASRALDQLTAYARRRGIEVTWTDDGDRRIALIKYHTNPKRRDVVLEAVEIGAGAIRLHGRSDKEKGPLASPSLPSGRFLRSSFPSKKVQAPGAGVS